VQGLDSRVFWSLTLSKFSGRGQKLGSAKHDLIWWPDLLRGVCNDAFLVRNGQLLVLLVACL